MLQRGQQGVEGLMDGQGLLGGRPVGGELAAQRIVRSIHGAIAKGIKLGSRAAGSAGRRVVVVRA